MNEIQHPAPTADQLKPLLAEIERLRAYCENSAQAIYNSEMRATHWRRALLILMPLLLSALGGVLMILRPVFYNPPSWPMSEDPSWSDRLSGSLLQLVFAIGAIAPAAAALSVFARLDMPSAPAKQLRAALLEIGQQAQDLARIAPLMPLPVVLAAVQDLQTRSSTLARISGASGNLQSAGGLMLSFRRITQPHKSDSTDTAP